MGRLKRLSLFPFLFFVIWGQSYTLNVYGIPLAKATLAEPSAAKINLSYNTVGLGSFFWPSENYYYTDYDSLTLGVRRFKKKIRQGSFEQKVMMTYEGGYLKFNKNERTKPNPVFSLFTLLKLAQVKTARELDTHRFPVDLEGLTYEARFLWADSVQISIQGKDVLCDHYRLDFIRKDENKPLFEKTDTLMGIVSREDLVRQIWVEQNENHRIIKVEMTVYGLPFEAILNHD